MIGRLPDFPEEVLFWYAFLLPLAAWWNPTLRRRNDDRILT